MEHITFQSHFVQLSSYRFQIKVDSRRRLREGFGVGGIPATNVKRISSANLNLILRSSRVTVEEFSPSKRTSRMGKESSLWDASLPLVADRLGRSYATY
jgi:hypothetical protein